MIPGFRERGPAKDRFCLCSCRYPPFSVCLCSPLAESAGVSGSAVSGAGACHVYCSPPAGILCTEAHRFSDRARWHDATVSTARASSKPRRLPKACPAATPPRTGRGKEGSGASTAAHQGHGDTGTFFMAGRRGELRDGARAHLLEAASLCWKLIWIKTGRGLRTQGLSVKDSVLRTLVFTMTQR